jgi:hypothetical protein
MLWGLRTVRILMQRRDLYDEKEGCLRDLESGVDPRAI